MRRKRDGRSERERELDRLAAELEQLLAIIEAERAAPSGPPIVTPRGLERALFSQN